MNRDIKFRAWDKKSKVIIPWDLISESRTLAFFVNNHNRNISNCVLMQFTGLIDRNGKDIYEGDIVEFYEGDIVEYSRTFKVKIIFQDGGFKLQGPQDMGSVFLKYFTCDNAVSVIGNIYENPNILEQPNQGE